MSGRLVVSLSLLGCAGLCAAPADGAVIVDYTFAGAANTTNTDANTGNATPASVDGNFLSSASAMSTSNQDPAIGVRLQFRSTGTLTNPAGGGGNAAFPTLEGRVTTAAPDPAKWFQFSVTANSSFDLTQLDFDMAEGATNAADSRGAQVLLSLDNFATAGTSLGTFTVPDAAAAADAYYHFTANFADIPITNGQVVTFRYLPFVSSGAAGGVRFDNIQVSAVVPEPASLAALGLGAAALLVRRPRQR